MSFQRQFSEQESIASNEPLTEARRNQSVRLWLWFCLLLIAWLCYFLSVETLKTSRELQEKRDLFGQAKLAFQTMRSIPRLEQRLRFENHRQVDVFFPQWRTSRYMEALAVLNKIGAHERDWSALFWMEEEQYQTYPSLDPNLTQQSGTWKTFLGKVFRLETEAVSDEFPSGEAASVNALKALNDLSISEGSMNMPPWVIGVGFELKDGQDKKEKVANILQALELALKTSPSKWLVEPLLDEDLRQVGLEGLPPDGWTIHPFRLRIESEMNSQNLFPKF